MNLSLHKKKDTVFRTIDIGCGNNFFLKTLQQNCERVGVALRGIGGEPGFSETTTDLVEFFSEKTSKIIKHQMRYEDFNLPVECELDFVCINSPHPFTPPNWKKFSEQAYNHLVENGFIYVAHSEIGFIPKEIEGFERVDCGKFPLSGGRRRMILNPFINGGSFSINETLSPVVRLIGGEKDESIHFPASPVINSNILVQRDLQRSWSYGGGETRFSRNSEYVYSNGCIPGFMLFQKRGV